MVITGNRAGWLAWWASWLVVSAGIILDGPNPLLGKGALAVAALGIVLTPLIDRRNPEKTRIR